MNPNFTAAASIANARSGHKTAACERWRGYPGFCRNINSKIWRKFSEQGEAGTVSEYADIKKRSEPVKKSDKTENYNIWYLEEKHVTYLPQGTSLELQNPASVNIPFLPSTPIPVLSSRSIKHYRLHYGTDEPSSTLTENDVKKLLKSNRNKSIPILIQARSRQHQPSMPRCLRELGDLVTL